MSTRKSMAVYTVRPAEKEGQRDYWTQIGTAFPHPNGEGFNVLLNATPLNGKLVVIPRKETQLVEEDFSDVDPSEPGLIA